MCCVLIFNFFVHYHAFQHWNIKKNHKIALKFNYFIYYDLFHAPIDQYFTYIGRHIQRYIYFYNFNLHRNDLNFGISICKRFLCVEI